MIQDPEKRKENHRRYMKEVWYPKNKDKHIKLVTTRKARPEIKEQTNANSKANREKTKVWVIQQYGGRCSCPGCPENDARFLTLDHVNGDGSIHRKTMKYDLYTWARKNNCPDTLRLMCWNCNCGRYQNGGTCPHEDKLCGVVALVDTPVS